MPVSDYPKATDILGREATDGDHVVYSVASTGWIRQGVVSYVTERFVVIDEQTVYGVTAIRKPSGHFCIINKEVESL